ncbi:helix-turn-helix domain-containing protein [Hymenobacter sublimis]|uniref:Helix-turn-helix domain-containing protein n=1 Tax=Hymenobacter sublimis TaxID=2933777 RepID=A0ABY4J8U5_9BACT|nr:helix-turn-helix transcriptional regulator [Hymenobacter sublimis]UPL49020.1 helix-turn-helix domain-containing protein [Hymenobacter sublimis]
MFSAARIATIRKSKGLSQEVLAEQSGVSLRTIQRVEQGDTVPRGFTLQALATALEVPLEAFRTEPAELVVASVTAPGPMLGPPAAAATPVLVAQPELAPSPKLRSDPDFLQLLNLSALSFLLVPLLNLVVPWWLWRTRRYSVEHAAEVGRRVLGFQILWQVCSFFAFLLVLIVHLSVAPNYRPVLPGVYVAVVAITYGLNVLTIGYNSWQLRQGRLELYWIRL